MPQTYHALWVHLVWSTKQREPLIIPSIKWPLYNKIKAICEDKHYYLDHINGVEDHVHLLMELHPKFAISDVVKNIKGLSWEWMRQEQTTDEYFSWQDGFAVISVSPSQLQVVRRYSQNQEEHHRKVSFEDEIKQYGFVFERH